MAEEVRAYDTDPDTGERICIFRNIGPHNILERNPFPRQSRQYPGRRGWQGEDPCPADFIPLLYVPAARATPAQRWPASHQSTPRLHHGWRW